MENSEILYYKNLIVKIFVIGYSTKGESIVVLFLNREKPLPVYFSMVIDSFAVGTGKKRVNKTIDILKSYKIDEVNILCWSHPDYDHTYGLDDILYRYCSENTKILIPYGIEGRESDHVDYNKGDVDRLKYMLKLSKTKSTVYPINVVEKLFHPVSRFDIAGKPDNVEIQIDAISPFGNQLLKIKDEYQHTKKKIYKNDYSIALSMKIGAYVFNFCSDIMGPMVNDMNIQPFRNCLFVKIPHHSSSSTQNIVQYLPTRVSQESSTPDALTLACTTVYTNHELPDFRVLDDYRYKHHIIHCTGSSDNIEECYGIVRYTFDLYGKKEIKICNYGHAFEVNHEIKSLPKSRVDGNIIEVATSLTLCYDENNIKPQSKEHMYARIKSAGELIYTKDVNTNAITEILVLLEFANHDSKLHSKPSEIFASEAQQISFMKFYVELIDKGVCSTEINVEDGDGNRIDVKEIAFEEKFNW